ncbi:ROK family protein [Pseudonocardia sp. GCM10023141]|uniref:ROK family protein n=1 Tax=Pseudonocardia sp. GCM10023141 TaxID=3252653 RepID=UPI00362458A3
MASVPEQTPPAGGWAALDGSHRLVAVEVLRHGPLPRSELSRRLGLSPGSLTRLTRPLVDSGLLVEGTTAVHVRTGRPSLPLDVRPGSRQFVGVKITADELYAVVTDLRAEVLAEHVRPLPGRDPDAVVAAVAEVVAELRAAHPDVTALGVGIGGLAVGHRHVVVARFLGWTDVPLADRLAAATGLPTVVDNDVRALTAAEHWFGDGRGRHSFALLTIGAGVGCGVVVHDRVVEGAHGAGGSVGHRPFGAGGVCREGHRGCTDAVLTSSSVAGGVAQAIGRPVTYAEALQLARDGHPAAQRVVGDAGRALGLLITDIANLMDPALVILSGEGVGIVELARPELDATLAEHRSGAAPPVELAVRPIPFTGWARGGAAVAIQDHVLGRADPVTSP